MANLKKVQAENVEAVAAPAVNNSIAEVNPEASKPKTAKANSTTKKPVEKKPIEKKPAEKKATEKKPVDKKTAVTPVTEKKTTAKKPAAPKNKPLSLDDIVAKGRVKANSGDTSKVTKRIAATFSVNGMIDGDFYMLIDTGMVSVEPYKYDDADLWIKGSADDITAIFDNKLKFIDAVSSGKVEIWGEAKDAVIFSAAIF